MERLVDRQDHDRARDDPYEQVNRAIMDSQMEVYQFMENVSHLAKQSEARAQDAPMVGPEPNSIASFHKLALDLIDETVSVLHFRIGHSKDWSELRNRIPAHLREPLSKARRLAGDLSIAEHELKRAIDDNVWYGVRAVPMHEARLSGEEARKELRTRFLEEMKQELAQLKERVAEANEAERSTAEARDEAEVELAREWREEHHARLARLLAEYEPHYSLHRHRIGGLVAMQNYSLGELADGTSSGCQVLLTFAQRVHNGRINRFHGLDAAHLKAVVENEIGWLARSMPSIAARHPQNVATTSSDTIDEQHSGRSSTTGDDTSSGAQPDKTTVAETPIAEASHRDATPSFIRAGKLWHITFEGKRVTMPHLVGLQHIQHLLAHPHTDVNVADLVKLGPVEAGTSQPTLSREAVEAAKSERAELVGRIDEAQKMNDQGRHEKLAEDLCRLDATLKNAHGISKVRPIPDALSRQRTRIGKAITTALAALKQEHPGAHHHLLGSILTPSGLTPSYRPKTPTTWLVNPTA